LIYFIITIAGWILYVFIKRKSTDLQSSDAEKTRQKEANKTRKNQKHQYHVNQWTICHLAGAPYYIGGKSYDHMKLFESDQILTASRESKNAYDANAIGLYLNENQVGHIPKIYNVKHSEHMDKGGKLKVKILRVDYEDPWKGVTLEICNL